MSDLHIQSMRAQSQDAYNVYKTNEADIVRWLKDWIQENYNEHAVQGLFLPFKGKEGNKPDFLVLANALVNKSDKRNPGFQEIKQKIRQIETVLKKRVEHYERLVELGEKPAGGDKGHQQWTDTWNEMKGTLAESPSYRSRLLRALPRAQGVVVPVQRPKRVGFEVLRQVHAESGPSTSSKPKRKRRKSRASSQPSSQVTPAPLQSPEVTLDLDGIEEDDDFMSVGPLRDYWAYERLMAENERAREWEDQMEAENQRMAEEARQLQQEARRREQENQELKKKNTWLGATVGLVGAVAVAAWWKM